MNISEKLYRFLFRINHGKPHIRLDVSECAKCLEKNCLNICPVDNFFLENDEVVLKWQDCVECGACRIACTRQSLYWNYPDGGFGISYRYG